MAAKRRYRVRFRAPGKVLLSACLGLLLFLTHAACASVALLLEQPYGGLSMINPTGHSAIYLDHVCAAGPLELRTCHPGELGVVISRYDGIDGRDWIAIPLLPYLYSVDSIAEIPSSVDRVTERRLRDIYRRRSLEQLAPDTPAGEAPDGNWYELVGSSFDRTIYGFQVDSTPEQDARLIALMNDRRNVESYNGAFRNCADFARVAINRFYPHAVRRNFIADFGISTPKSVARALTHYAHKHPGTNLQVFVIPQVKGELPRSHEVQGVAESLLKKYGVPMAVISPTTAAVVLAAYVEHGRFDMPRNAPELDLVALQTSSEIAIQPVSSTLTVESPETPASSFGDADYLSPGAASEGQLAAPSLLDFGSTAVAVQPAGSRYALPASLNVLP